MNAYLVDNNQIGGTDQSHPWIWPYLTRMNRIAEHVAKVSKGSFHVNCNQKLQFYKVVLLECFESLRNYQDLLKFKFEYCHTV